jgi:hypothetical protein
MSVIALSAAIGSRRASPRRVPDCTWDDDRLAYERGQAGRLDLEPLLKKAGLIKQQVEDVHARISAQSQISFLDLVASALQDEHLVFHIGQTAEL